MFIWGRLIGVLFFGILWGWLGLIIGYILGYFFDQGLKRNMLTPEQQKIINTSFFKATFMVAGCIAKADGNVSVAEINFIEATIKRLQLTSEQRKFAIDCFNQGKAQNFDLQQALRDFVSVCKHQKLLITFFLEVQVALAVTQDNLAPKSLEILDIIGVELGINKFIIEQLIRINLASKNFQNNKQYYNNTQTSQRHSYSDAYTVLGVKQTDSYKVIKAAYRKLISQHHPDKLVAQGVPQEMINLAKEKTQQITAAYEIICKHRNFR